IVLVVYLISCVRCFFFFFFFFSSRRRHTRCYRDWSSDVCSSDLVAGDLLQGQGIRQRVLVSHVVVHEFQRLRHRLLGAFQVPQRSEERRVGKECRSRG